MTDVKDSMFLKYLGVIAAVAGASFSLYLGIHHYQVLGGTASESWCNLNATFNCDLVNASQYSKFLGVALGFWGAFYFATTCLFLLLPKMLGAIGGLAIATGPFVSAILFGISQWKLKALCLNCIIVYALCLIVTLAGAKLVRREWAIPTLGGWASMLAPLFVVLLWNNHLANALQAEDDVHPEEVIRMFTNAPQFQMPVRDRPLFPTSAGNEPQPRVLVHEFVDFECPHCARINPLLSNIARQYPGQVAITFRSFPLSNRCNSKVQHTGHINSCTATMVANCAVGNPNQYWKIIKEIFAKQGSLSETMIKEIGQAHGLNQDQIAACLASDSPAQKLLLEDIDDATLIGLKGTPTILVNGRLLNMALTPKRLRIIFEHLGAKAP